MNIYFLNDYNFINHRLTSVKNDNATTMTITYSANGNIASKTGIGAYSYSTSRPHAVVGVENISRVISSEYQSITYSPFNKVQTITQANKKLTIKYGPDKQRVKTIYANGKTTQTRIYAGDFERLSQNGSTTGYQYIYSPDGLVGIYVKPSNSNGTMYYATTDHLGSLLRLYNANGTQTFSAEYDAWGKQTANQNTFNLRCGYCQHEHWNEFGLIDMNGRFYDPQLGRFLSPDPYVQDMTNPQNFNRYSYCLNNPLKYTDPSGEFWHIVIGAVIGGVANLVSGLVSHKIDNVGQGFAYFGIGAVAGAAGAAVGAGVSSCLAGGSFGAGAIGVTTTTTTTAIGATGFCSGFVSGAASGFASGTTLGLGNGLIEGKHGILNNAWSYGWKGAVTSAVIGGLYEGINAKAHGKTFWRGADKYKQDVIISVDGDNYDMIDARDFNRIESEVTKDYYKTDLYSSPDVEITCGEDITTFRIAKPQRIDEFNLSTLRGDAIKGEVIALKDAYYAKDALYLSFYNGMEPTKVAISGYRYYGLRVSRNNFHLRYLFGNKNWGIWGK